MFIILPLGMAADTREASQAIVPSSKANIEDSVKVQEETATILMVRMPAGRSGDRRSYPIIEPAKMLAKIRRAKSHSRGVSNSNSQYLHKWLASVL
eukprot:3586753-Pyramimonas_sp.AAC.1